MNISFYKKFWFKTLICFIGVMLLTVIIVLSNFRRDRPKAMYMIVLDDLGERTENIARIFSESFSEGENIDKIKSSLYRIGLISRLHITLFDPEGKIIYKTNYRSRKNPGQFHFVPNPPITLTSQEVEKLKKQEAFSNYSHKKHPRFLSVYPIYKNGKFFGAIMTSMQFGGPPPPMNRRFDNLLIRSIILAIIIVTFAAFFITSSFTGPVREMIKAVNKISQGDFSYRINSKKDDELALLCNAFDAMSEKIEKSLKGRMQLIADISHELMTPLASIQGCSEAIIDGIVKDEDKKKKYLHIILNQTKRLSLLKNDLSQLSKFEYREIKISWNPFPVKYPINRAIESVQLISEEKNSKITTKIPDESLEVVGDKDRILQVIQNLLNNAIQHNQNKIEITVSAKKKDDCVIVSVEDNGTGIPKDEIENVFERCYKVDKSRVKGESGSGLGLAIAKEIIEAHGSKIELTSSEKGAKFSFSLKLA